MTQENSDKESQEEKILADIKKTGFPLEIWAAAELKKLAWNVAHQGYYEDFQSKPGSIDLVASKLTVKQATIPQRLQVKVLVECKQIGKNKPREDKEKEQKPWVFFIPTGFPFEDTFTATVGITHAFHGVENRDQRLVYQTLAMSHLFRNNPRFSVIALEAFSEGWNTTTYEGISQVVKATAYYKTVLEESLKSAFSKKFIESALLVIYPIVIFDGPIFELTIDGKGELTLAKSHHIVHMYEFQKKRYFIEVVDKESFPVLINEIDTEIGRFGPSSIEDSPI